jgi:hypothetical protein
MGEFERSGMGPRKGSAWALADIVTPENFLIALAAALVGYALVVFLRTKL